MTRNVSGTRRNAIESRRVAVARKRRRLLTRFLRRNPTVKAALAQFTDLIEKLKQASSSETAQTIFDKLKQTRDSIVQAVEAAMNSSLGVSVRTKLSELQDQASTVLEQYKEKLEDAKAGVGDYARAKLDEHLPSKPASEIKE